MSIGLFITMSIGSNVSESLSNLSISLNPSKEEEQLQKQAEFESTVQPFMSGLAFAFIFYIVALVLTFVLRRTVIIGIILLVLGGISVPITNFYGIIPFALLLPAAIVAFREKKGQHPQTVTNTKQDHSPDDKSTV
jgi:glucan phosphoethanolaminetransferase (alkaline phosphatase superfamily)